MPAKKRSLEDAAATPRAKKSKLADEDKSSKKSKEKGKLKEKAEPPLQPTSNLITEEVDFPRGGGTTLTPLEVKAIRAEGLKEAEDELFKEQAQMKKRRKSDVKKAKIAKTDTVRVEHLNYKRIMPGMKILGQVFSIQPLALIISLPNQLFGHVPVTQISTQLTQRLETLEEEDEKSVHSSGSEDEDEEENPGKASIPELFEMFRPGQYVRAVVTAVHVPGLTDTSGLGQRPRDETEKASRRVELSLVPERVNAGVIKADLKKGFTISAVVKSVEDHGYILDMGVPDVSGFLSFDDAKKGPFDPDAKLPVGVLVDAVVSKMSKNGRTCTVSVDAASFATASLSEVSTVTSVVPGALVQALITAVVPSGLNLQVLGFFEGTIDRYHLLPGELAERYNVGQKVKARVLYQTETSSPPRFALSLAQHVVRLDMKRVTSDDKIGEGALLHEAYAVGNILEEVKVLRVEAERGLVVEVQPGVEGFIHISHTSDDHVPTLSSSTGPWKVDTVHRARVIGYVPFDGLLQLSLRQSVLAQAFLNVSDVHVGSVVKGTIKALTPSALFVSMSGAVDGVVWPDHYADIALRHPQKRFRPGAPVRCRVLRVDVERRRIVLTAKKTLVDSTLPILASYEDARVGLVTHAVVRKVAEKSLQVEFYGDVRAVVPFKEVSETPVASLTDAFPVGKPVKVRVISVDAEQRRMAVSIRQGSSGHGSTFADVSAVEIGNAVDGDVVEVHKDNAVLALQPTRVRALLSLANLANHRGSSVAQLRANLSPGERVDGLVIVTRNVEKAFVIVACRREASGQAAHKGAVSWETVEPGQVVGGRVLGHTRRGASVKLGSRVTGALHPTDCADDYEQGAPFPAADSILKAIVVAVDREKRLLTLSTRPSRLRPSDASPVVDREINDVKDLKVGETVRGFIKSVAEHGLFVTIGRNVDARVQIKELFDEYVKDWKPRFQANQLVKGKVISVDTEKKQAEMSFRSGDRSSSSVARLKLSDLSEGQKVEGRVKKIEDYGLFIEIEGSKLSGLCHKSQLSDNKDADVTLALRSFNEGDMVKAIVLSIDHEKRRISLGLKPSYFTDEDFAMADTEDADADDAASFGLVEEEEEEAGDDSAPEAPSGNSEDEGSAASAEDLDESDDDGAFVEGETIDVDVLSRLDTHRNAVAGPSRIHEPAPSLDIKSGFQWSAQSAQAHEYGAASESSSEDEVEEPSIQKKKRRKKGIEQDLTADMHTKTPESNADFERLLLGSPNSSYLWIQYMSFQLQLSEVEKAREVGRRALRTISFREEQEKLNVWVALLNLENAYGTEETLETVFKEAARSNDSKTIHLRLAAIFNQSDKAAKAEEQFKRTCKKFGQSSKAWTLFGEHYMRLGQVEDARKLLPRSLQSLEKRKHLKTISKFAQMEYKLGDPERGKTIFEGIVDSHPKRFDLWSVYMDMEAGQQDIENLRNLFDRVLAMKMTSHKAKAFFKKWLELERTMGDEDGAAAVKQKAVEWTQRVVSGV